MVEVAGAAEEPVSHRREHRDHDHQQRCEGEQHAVTNLPVPWYGEYPTASLTSSRRPRFSPESSHNEQRGEEPERDHHVTPRGDREEHGQQDSDEEEPGDGVERLLPELDEKHARGPASVTRLARVSHYAARSLPRHL